jgi:uncharacterized protein YecE (DUF72 family)
MILRYLGTSGFSYQDWVGNYYPSNVPRQDWLRFYAREFNALELNSSYYAIPSPSVVKSLVTRTGEGFQFAIKLNQSITHERQAPDDAFKAFNLMLEPFIASGKLGCVLAQFPFSFHNNKQNQDYVEKVKSKFENIPLVAEFRSIYWIKPAIFDWLRGLNIGYCCVDEPHLPNLIPPVAEVTSNIAYVRFHGRNAAKWWQHEEAYERYDYTYSQEELEEWIPKIKGLESHSEKTFIFANNHWKGQSVDTIRQLKLMLD